AWRIGPDSVGARRRPRHAPDTKTPAPSIGAGIEYTRTTVWQRRRLLIPPCRRSGQRSELCYALSSCFDPLASAGTLVGRNLITVFLTVNTPSRFSSARGLRQSRPQWQRRHVAT